MVIVSIALTPLCWLGTPNDFWQVFLTLNITGISTTKTSPPVAWSQCWKSYKNLLLILLFSLTLIRVTGAGNKFETPEVPIDPLNPHRGFLCWFVGNFFWQLFGWHCSRWLVYFRPCWASEPKVMGNSFDAKPCGIVLFHLIWRCIITMVYHISHSFNSSPQILGNHKTRMS